MTSLFLLLLLVHKTSLIEVRKAGKWQQYSVFTRTRISQSGHQKHHGFIFFFFIFIITNIPSQQQQQRRHQPSTLSRKMKENVTFALISLLTSSYTIEQLKNWLFVEQFYVYHRIWDSSRPYSSPLARRGGAFVRLAPLFLSLQRGAELIIRYSQDRN